MNILVFEYITGGGMVDQALPSSLAIEGDIMLNAVVSDFNALKDIHVTVLRDYRLLNTGKEENVLAIGQEQDPTVEIEKLNPELDAAIFIAPESSNILTSLCERFANQSFVLLNSTTDSIKLTTDKYATYKHLEHYDVEQIPTYMIEDTKYLSSNKFIMKPIDGVGCEHIFVSSDISELKQKALKYSNQKFIFQPYMQGLHASLSLLCWDGQCHILSCNEQVIVENEGCIALRQCHVNSIDKNALYELSNTIVQALPGLRGYIGVDVLITARQVYLVEINPRLTSSYVGLNAALGINPAELILRCFLQQQLPEVDINTDLSVKVDLETGCAA